MHGDGVEKRHGGLIFNSLVPSTLVEAGMHHHNRVLAKILFAISVSCSVLPAQYILEIPGSRILVKK
jgi:hypothetical protein